MPDADLPLGGLCSFEYGTALPSQIRKDGNVSVVGSAGPVGWHNIALVAGPGVVIGRKGTVGKATWVDSDFWPIDTTYFVKPADGVDLRWLFFLLDWLPLRSLDSATGVPGLNRNDAYKLRIRYVPEDVVQQKRTAEILAAIDDAISATDALIAKLRTMRLGIVDDLLTRGLSSTGSPRNPKELTPTEVGLRPSNWTVAPLGRFVLLAEYGTNLSLGDLEEGLPVLRMNNIQDGEFDLSELRYAPTQAVDRFRLQKNDVLFNRTNSWEHVGKAAIWRRDEAGPAFASYLVRLHCSDELLPEFLHLWINWAVVQRAIRQFATPGVQQVNINPTNLRRASIAVPDTLEEQQAIVDRIDAIAAMIEHHRTERGKLADLRSGLRDDLLTGRVPVIAIREAAE
jgi:type I restriction enzyme, S subunit